MALNIDEKNLKQGVLGLVIAIVEVIWDALRIQATKRMESGSLTEEEIERLGRALMDMDATIQNIKKEQGLTESVQKIREGLDNLVNDILDPLTNPIIKENHGQPTCSLSNR